MSKFRLQSYIYSFPLFLKHYTPFIFTLAIPPNLIKPDSNFLQQIIKILLTLYRRLEISKKINFYAKLNSYFPLKMESRVLLFIKIHILLAFQNLIAYCVAL